ncbi:recombinase family protein [Rhizobium sp. IMFF44]|uniref:recombinase family protein n=1 Tax=Rhizobium sp. IMFF44 TaxID=3342350 RepID=UPI0035BB3A74
MSHLFEVIEDLSVRGAHFRLLQHPIDSSITQRMLSRQVLGGVAQLERALISERAKGIKGARTTGGLPVDPASEKEPPEALAKMTAMRNAAYADRIEASASQWLPSDASSELPRKRSY